MQNARTQNCPPRFTNPRALAESAPPTRGNRVWASIAIALFLGACSSPTLTTRPDWLPRSDGWTVRDIDESEPLRWVLYERDAREADVKAIRLVGVVDAEPAEVARALRARLLDDAHLPEGTTRRLVRQAADEVVFYGFSTLPFPFDDREVTERMRFTQDRRFGIHMVHVRSIDPGEPAKPGVLRIPLVDNRFVIAPAGPGRSSVTMDSVHDLGGNFPNWLIYGPVGDFMVDELAALAEDTAPAKTAGR